MTEPYFLTPDPKLDLVLQRDVDVPPEMVWAAWTQPEHLKVWFTPRPWTVTECKIDLRPGGLFRTVMRSPEGQEMPSDGCYLDVKPMERLVFTDAFLPGFRPVARPFMTAIITMAPHGKGTRYTATALHKDEESRKQHEEMGFHGGWSTALDQLVKHMRGEKF